MEFKETVTKFRLFVSRIFSGPCTQSTANLLPNLECTHVHENKLLVYRSYSVSGPEYSGVLYRLSTVLDADDAAIAVGPSLCIHSLSINI